MLIRSRKCVHVLLLLGVVSLLSGCGRNASTSMPGDDRVDAGTPTLQADAARSTDRATTLASASEQEIGIDNFSFAPAELTVPAGAKVTWVNHDDVPHTATSSVKPRQFDSGTLDTDERFSHVFTTPGTYQYFCALHPRMVGQVIVK